MERDTTVQLTLLVDASPETIWKALTDPQLTKLYLGSWQARSTWKTGASLLWIETEEGTEQLRAQGTVMACLPGRRLRYTRLLTNGKLPDEPASYTTVDIVLDGERDGRTRVELYHGDFAGLPHDVRTARAAGRTWVEALVGLKRISEEQQAAIAA
ncbi:MAG: SRPBCC domain-containing protein [Flavobacteriales bacterium]